MGHVKIPYQKKFRGPKTLIPAARAKTDFELWIHQQKWTRSKIGGFDPYLTPLNTSECNESRWGIHFASVGGAQGVTDQ